MPPYPGRRGPRTLPGQPRGYSRPSGVLGPAEKRAGAGPSTTRRITVLKAPIDGAVRERRGFDGGSTWVSGAPVASLVRIHPLRRRWPRRNGKPGSFESDRRSGSGSRVMARAYFGRVVREKPCHRKAESHAHPGGRSRKPAGPAQTGLVSHCRNPGRRRTNGRPDPGFGHRYLCRNREGDRGKRGAGDRTANPHRTPDGRSRGNP